MLKNLYHFERFDLIAFLMGKELTVTDCRPWKDRDSQQELGLKYEVAITKDKTAYPPAKDGRTASNLYEKFTVKVPKTLSVPIGAVVTIVNGTATIYGDYRNQLSVRAEDLKVVQAPDPGMKED